MEIHFSRFISVVTTCSPYRLVKVSNFYRIDACWDLGGPNGEWKEYLVQSDAQTAEVFFDVFYDLCAKYREDRAKKQASRA